MLSASEAGSGVMLPFRSQAASARNRGKMYKNLLIFLKKQMGKDTKKKRTTPLWRGCMRCEYKSVRHEYNLVRHENSVIKVIT